MKRLWWYSDYHDFKDDYDDNFDNVNCDVEVFGNACDVEDRDSEENNIEDYDS